MRVAEDNLSALNRYMNKNYSSENHRFHILITAYYFENHVVYTIQYFELKREIFETAVY